MQLADGNGDGIIPFGADGELDVFGSSELQVRNGAQTIDQLAFAGTVSIDGTTYYSYGLAPGDHGGGSASLGLWSSMGSAEPSTNCSPEAHGRGRDAAAPFLFASLAPFIPPGEALLHLGFEAPVGRCVEGLRVHFLGPVIVA